MSNVAHGDPESIRAFAKLLAEFCESTQEHLSKVRGNLREMGNSTWSDSVYRDYLEQFEEVSGQINIVINGIHQNHPMHLYKIAQRLEEYLRGGS